MVTMCDTVIVAVAYYNGDKMYIITVVCLATVPLRRTLVDEGQDVKLIDYMYLCTSFHSGPNPFAGGK